MQVMHVLSRKQAPTIQTCQLHFVYPLQSLQVMRVLSHELSPRHRLCDLTSVTPPRWPPPQMLSILPSRFVTLSHRSCVCCLVSCPLTTACTTWLTLTPPRWPLPRLLRCGMLCVRGLLPLLMCGMHDSVSGLLSR